MSLDTDIAGLRAAIAQYSGPGITDPGGAVRAMQAVGNSAVAAIGPAIDSVSGGNAQVMQTTQFAWIKNGVLAGVRSGSDATLDDVQTAASALGDMATNYEQAYRLAKSVAPAPAKPAAVAAPARAPAPAPVATAAHPAAMAAPTALPLAAAHGHLTEQELLATGGGALIGLALGARALGFGVGGPIGGLLGAALGYQLAKMLKV